MPALPGRQIAIPPYRWRTVPLVTPSGSAFEIEFIEQMPAQGQLTGGWGRSTVFSGTNFIRDLSTDPLLGYANVSPSPRGDAANLSGTEFGPVISEAFRYSGRPGFPAILPRTLCISWSQLAGDGDITPSGVPAEVETEKRNALNAWLISFLPTLDTRSASAFMTQTGKWHRSMLAGVPIRFSQSLGNPKEYHQYRAVTDAAFGGDVLQVAILSNTGTEMYGSRLGSWNLDVDGSDFPEATLHTVPGPVPPDVILTVLYGNVAARDAAAVQQCLDEGRYARHRLVCIYPQHDTPLIPGFDPAFYDPMGQDQAFPLTAGLHPNSQSYVVNYDSIDAIIATIESEVLSFWP